MYRGYHEELEFVVKETELVQESIEELELEIDKMIELKKFNKYAKQKPQWKLDSNQIVNSNAINYFKHWFEFEHMTNKYQYLTKSIDNLIKFNKILSPRKAGICKGEVEISNDFDELPPELLSKFYNKI